MEKKRIIKIAGFTGIGVVILAIISYFAVDFVKKSNPSQKIKMVKSERGYSIPVLIQNEKKEFDVINFKVEAKVVDSLGFTQEEVRNACSAGADRARNYLEEFIYNGTPEIKVMRGKTIVVIPMIVSKTNSNEMFIIGEVTKTGRSLSMRATIEPKI